MKRLTLAMSMALTALLCLPLHAQTLQKTANVSEDDLKYLVNKGTVGIVSGGVSGTYVRIAADLAAVLDEGHELRVVPMIGKGSVQNITDILYLKGTDIGIVQSDVLAFIKANRLHPNVQKRIQYITKLYNEEFHLVAHRDIRSVADLAGRKVNFGNAGSGSEMTAETVFAALGLDVDATSFDTELALEKVRSGELAAMVYVAGKPVNALQPFTAADDLHLLPVAYDGALQDAYLPSRFTAEDYPGLVPEGKPVDTIAVGAVMAVFNWERNSYRYNKVARFVEAMFERFDEFRQPPRHTKWREVNLALDLPGWTRFPAAAEWLEANAPQADASERERFESFIAEHGKGGAGLTEAEANDLFERFLAWRESADPS